jgi:hypothetical protein
MPWAANSAVAAAKMRALVASGSLVAAMEERIVANQLVG